MIPRWLADVFARCESLSLDSEGDRAALAAAIVEAIPCDEILATLREGVGNKLRGPFDDIRPGVIDDIARNAAQRVVLLLEAT